MRSWLLAGAAALAGSAVAAGVKRAANKGRTYFGLAELYRARGDIKSAQDAKAQLAKTWVGDTSLLNISRL